MPLEWTGDLRPGIPAFDQVPAGRANLAAPPWVVEQIDDRPREVLRAVGGDKVAAGFDVQSLGAKGG